MLWVVGGSLDVKVGDGELHIPGFLVIAALVYSFLATGSMVFIGRQFVRLSETNNQPAIALATARLAVERAGRGDLAVAAAAQNRVTRPVRL